MTLGPPPSGPERTWWDAGARREAWERDHYLAPEVLEVRETLEALARERMVQDHIELLVMVTAIYAPFALRRKYRLRARRAWKEGRAARLRRRGYEALSRRAERGSDGPGEHPRRSRSRGGHRAG